MANALQIAPSLLACDLSNLGNEIRNVDAAGADVLHIDVMDGHFVPNLSIGIPIIASARKHSKLVFDAHLMISDPDKYLEAFKEAGADWLSVHIEACPDANVTLKNIKKLGMKPGIVLNPDTPIEKIKPTLDTAEYVLVMSVFPGFGGQKFIPESVDRIKGLKEMIGDRSIPIQIDGGIKKENAKLVFEAGAEILVMGTGIFAAENYKSRIDEIRGECNGTNQT